MSVETSTNSSSRPAFLQNVDVFIMFDAPKDPINEFIQSFVGWFAAVRETFPAIYANGKLLENIHYYERPDVSGYSQGFFNRAWTFYLDCARYMTPEQGAITIEVFWEGKLVERKLYRVGTKILPTGERDLVAFLHVPKSGGTSLRRALENQAGNFTLLASYEDYGFLTIADLKKLSSRALSNFDGIYGHFRFGIHQNYERKVRYISFIRNPYNLILSYYFYAKSHLKDEKVLACRDIYEAMSTRTNVFFDNIVTRMFSGIDDDQAVDDDVFQTAINNIDNHFEFIGVTENSHASLKRAGAYLGLDLQPHQENVNTYPREFDLMDMTKFRKFAYDYVKFDLAIYEYALNKYWGAGNCSHIVAHSGETGGDQALTVAEGAGSA